MPADQGVGCANEQPGPLRGYNEGVNVTVLLFASIAEAAGTRKLEIAWREGDTVASVCDRVVAEFPALERFVPNLMFAIDENYAGADDAVQPGARVAFIPPVSGGC